MILVTGAAGFIGHALCQRLLTLGELVVGIDNLNDYYDVSLKTARLDQLTASKDFAFQHMDICDAGAVRALFRGYRPSCVVHLAAQAGVRYSLENPQAYVDSNITGFLNILDACYDNDVNHLVYASSSSVYGLNDKTPFSAEDRTDSPANMYAVTKKCNELMAHAYWNLYGLKSTGLRFFTVYGPWGRPDMAFFKFTKAIIEGEPIDVYNGGDHVRAFTYIDDIVDGILKAMEQDTGCNVFNLGGDEAIMLTRAIATLEKAIGKTAVINALPMQKGDVLATVAAPSRIPGWKPRIGLEEGVRRFVEWYRGFYHE